MNIEISIGELLDRYSILEIKQKNMSNKDKIKYIEYEINKIKDTVQQYVNKYTELYNNLLSINTKIWNTSDIIRNKDIYNQELYQKALEEIHDQNDIRYEIKNKINLISNSLLQEQKSYQKYNDEICLVKRSGAMGDVLLLEPFIRYLTTIYKRIWFVTSEKYKNVFKNHPNIEKIITDVIDTDIAVTYNMDNTSEQFLNYPFEISYFKFFNIDISNIDTCPKIYFDKEEIYNLGEGKWVAVDVGYKNGRQYYSKDSWEKIFYQLQKLGMKIVIIGNTFLYSYNFVDLDLRTENIDIRQLFCVIRSADYYIGIDSGPLHVAKLLGKPGIGIFCAYGDNFKHYDNTKIIKYKCDCYFNKHIVPCLKCNKQHIDSETIIQCFNYLLKNSCSQAGQDYFIRNCYNNKKNGFFVEIGSNNACMENNTFILETLYNWKGFLIEYEYIHLSSYNKLRTNSYHLINDACKIDYKKEFENKSFPKNIDYLQIDLEVDNMSTLNLLNIFNDNIFKEYKFGTVTFEHDIYRGDYFNTREISRNIFKNNGYYIVFEDVKINGLPFEDWYVHPDLVDMNYIEKIKTTKSLEYQDIINILENSRK